MRKFVFCLDLVITISIVFAGDKLYSQDSLTIANTGNNQNIIQFIFTSDVHFGLRKLHFWGATNVTAKKINAAMIRQMNRLPDLTLPNDTGVNARQKIKYIDALIITGDIANREETGIQSASKSWKQFCKDYYKLLHLKTPNNTNTPLLITPGNHDVSNAIGFHRPMKPNRDATSLIGMYNSMMHPESEKTTRNFKPDIDKIHYSLNLGGTHCMFVQLWPDSAERVWMAKDLSTVSASTPVLLFTHSNPDVEARFFINPNRSHDINDHDKFENLVLESFKDGMVTTDTALIEQRNLVAFLKQHQNIKGYFHGHSNFTEFYDWKGPDKDIILHCFRVDSPMKGKYSATDETRLSFELVSIDTKTKKITVRECLWNREPLNSSHPLNWGSSITLSLQ